MPGSSNNPRRENERPKVKVIAILLATVATACADPNYVTLTTKNIIGGIDNKPEDLVTISQYETAEIVSFYTVNNSNQPRIEIRKNGFVFPIMPDASIAVTPCSVTPIAGPAVIRLYEGFGYCTVKISPGSYPPGKSLIILNEPGRGAVVTLEQSTNLVDWVTATNGVYTSLPAATFFRIKADRVQ